MITYRPVLHHRQHAGPLWWLLQRTAAPREFCIAHYGYDSQVADSLPHALCHALVAAGMIEEDSDAE